MTKNNRGGVTRVTLVLIVAASNLVVLQICRRSMFCARAEAVAASQEDGSELSLMAVAPMNQLAYHHSYGFFDDISDTDWKLYYQAPALAARHYRWAYDHDSKADTAAASWIYFNWDPYFQCPHLRKIGGLGSGSKWTCDVERIRKVVERRRAADPSQQPHCCLIYSIGSHGNYQWEDGLHDVLGNICEIHIFDPGSFDRPHMSHKNMVFHQWGLGSSYSTAWMQRREGKGIYLSFQEIRQRLGHENRTIDLFKIDCENCEWHSYKDWIDADLRQIMIETHELPVADKEKRTALGILPAVVASEVFDTFKQNGFVLFSKEVNTHRGLGRSCRWSESFVCFVVTRDQFVRAEQKIGTFMCTPT